MKKIKDGPVKSYYENGTLLAEGTFKDDKRDGLFKLYHENGTLKYEATYKDDKRDGPFKSYYENGQLQHEETYKDGEWDGPVKSYYENGTLKYEATYKDGKFYIDWTEHDERVLSEKLDDQSDEDRQDQIQEDENIDYLLEQAEISQKELERYWEKISEIENPPLDFLSEERPSDD